MFFIVNMDSVDMLPSIAEPLFQEFNAKVDIYPAMNLDISRRHIQNEFSLGDSCRICILVNFFTLP
jgi:hypothetical protein